MKYLLFITVLSLPLIVNHAVFADDSPDASQYISREEYESLRQEFEAFKEEMRNAPPPATTPVTQSTVDSETQEYLEYLQTQLDDVKVLAQASAAGDTKFLVSGYTFTRYTDRENANSTFSLGFNPIFLWVMNDRIFFESELELGLISVDGTGETEVELEYANVSYLVNDYVTIGAGKFLTPFGTFGERLHPAWINKLPDMPLAFGHGGLAPGSSLGVYVRGGVPVGDSMKGNYSFFLSNGPRLNTGEDEPEEAGLLHNDNFVDSNNGKAIGGRVGLLPIPELEIGGSFLVAEVSPDGFDDTVSALLYGFDLGYVRNSPSLGGVIDVRIEWIFSDIDDATYLDEDGVPFMFNNKRDGGYVQLAYRPSESSNKFIKNLEGVCRFDMINQPSGAPESVDEQRYTFGLNYWLSPSAVLKLAYQIDDKSGAEDANALLFQAALGF